MGRGDRRGDPRRGGACDCARRGPGCLGRWRPARSAAGSSSTTELAVGELTIEDGLIAEVSLDEGASDDSLPFITPASPTSTSTAGEASTRWAGNGAHRDGPRAAPEGVTSLLPTAVTASLPDLATFAETVRGWRPTAPEDGAEPLGFNLEGPFLAEAKRGAP